MEGKSDFAQPLSRRGFFKKAALLTGFAGAAAAGWGVNASTLVERATRGRRPDLIELSEIAPHSIAVGVSPDGNNFDEVARSERALGVPAKVVNFFIGGTGDINRDNVLRLADRVVKSNRIPMISWSPMANDTMRGQKFEQYIERLADDLGSMRDEAWLRFYYEMNGSWMKQLPPDRFQNLWRDVHARMSRYDNIKLVFCPNYTSLTVPSFREFYPGNAYVDYFAFDFYEKSDPNIFHVRHATPVLTPEELIGPDVATMQDLTGGEVPFVVAELGVARDDAYGAAWIREAIPYLLRCNARMIGLFCWDKSGSGGTGEKDWRLTEGPDLRAYRREFQKDFFVHDLRPFFA